MSDAVELLKSMGFEVRETKPLKSEIDKQLNVQPIRHLIDGEGTVTAKSAVSGSRDSYFDVQQREVVYRGLLHCIKVSNIDLDDDDKDTIIAKLTSDGIFINEIFNHEVDEGDDLVIRESVIMYRHELFGMTETVKSLPDRSKEWSDVDIYPVMAIDSDNNEVSPRNILLVQPPKTIRYLRRVERKQHG